MRSATDDAAILMDVARIDGLSRHTGFRKAQLRPLLASSQPQETYCILDKIWKRFSVSIYELVHCEWNNS